MAEMLRVAQERSAQARGFPQAAGLGSEPYCRAGERWAGMLERVPLESGGHRQGTLGLNG